MQAKGQYKVITQSRPIAEVMADPAFPDSLKKRLLLVNEIRQYAIDSLGLKDTDSYHKLYDLKGKPIAYMLIVAHQYELVPVTWKFPIIGEFPYKGFFELEKVKKERDDWKAKNYDTRISEVAAYSTLGWFKDPILSSMLTYDDGRLAEVLIHEMTHATVFIPGKVEINENLANFVGDYGAERFLKYKYGVISKQVLEYQENKVFGDKFVKHINRGTLSLDSLYKTFKPTDAVAKKDTLKYHFIEKIVSSIDTLYQALPNAKPHKFDIKKLPNNAYFVSFKTYNAKQNEFEQEFNVKFKRNFKAYLAYLKTEYNKQ